MQSGCPHKLKHVAHDVPITTHPYITECLTPNPKRRRSRVAFRTGFNMSHLTWPYSLTPKALSA